MPFASVKVLSVSAALVSAAAKSVTSLSASSGKQAQGGAEKGVVGYIEKNHSPRQKVTLTNRPTEQCLERTFADHKIATLLHRHHEVQRTVDTTTTTTNDHA